MLTDCDPNPCVHGTCTSSIQGYGCSCNDGYTGSLCDRLKRMIALLFSKYVK